MLAEPARMLASSVAAEQGRWQARHAALLLVACSTFCGKRGLCAGGREEAAGRLLNSRRGLAGRRQVRRHSVASTGRGGGFPVVAGEDAEPLFEVLALLVAGVGPAAVLAVACLDRRSAAGPCSKASKPRLRPRGGEAGNLAKWVYEDYPRPPGRSGPLRAD